MTILITGAGLLGCYTAQLLLQRGEKVVLYGTTPNIALIRRICGKPVTIIKGDVLDLHHLVTVCAEYHPTDIIHTAIVRQKAAERNPQQALMVNVQGTRNIIVVAKKESAHIIYPSSAGVYGVRVITTKPVAEDTKLKPGTVYAKTKLQSEKLLLNYPNSTILRFPSLFGPWIGGTSTGNGLIRDMVSAAFLRKKITIKNPFPPCEQLYVKDAARAILLAMHAHLTKHRIYNIGTGQLVSYDAILSALKQCLPSAAITVKKIHNVIDFRNQPLDYSLAQKELGYQPQWTLVVALTDYTSIMEKLIKKKK